MSESKKVKSVALRAEVGQGGLTGIPLASSTPAASKSFRTLPTARKSDFVTPLPTVAAPSVSPAHAQPIMRDRTASTSHALSSVESNSADRIRRSGSVRRWSSTNVASRSASAGSRAYAGDGG